MRGTESIKIILFAFFWHSGIMKRGFFQHKKFEAPLLFLVPEEPEYRKKDTMRHKNDHLFLLINNFYSVWYWKKFGFFWWRNSAFLMIKLDQLRDCFFGYHFRKTELKLKKTVGYQRHILCLLVFVKKASKKLKTFLFRKSTLSSPYFLIFPTFKVLWLFAKKPHN